MTAIERVAAIENGMSCNTDDNYEYELAALQGVEDDLPVYRHLGSPLWKTQRVKEEIARLRAWINEELESRKKVYNEETGKWELPA